MGKPVTGHQDAERGADAAVGVQGGIQLETGLPFGKVGQRDGGLTAKSAVTRTVSGVNACGRVADKLSDAIGRSGSTASP